MGRVQENTDGDGDRSYRENDQQKTINDNGHLLPFDTVDMATIVVSQSDVTTVDCLAQFVQSPRQAALE